MNQVPGQQQKLQDKQYYYPFQYKQQLERNRGYSGGMSEIDQLKKFIKKADTINVENYRKLQMEPQVKEFKRYERSSGSLFKIDRGFSIDNIQETQKQKQIRRVYIGKTKKQPLKKKPIHIIARKTIASKQVQTQRNFGLISNKINHSIDYGQPILKQTPKTHRQIQHSTLDHSAKFPGRQNPFYNVPSRRKLASLYRDNQQQGAIPKKKAYKRPLNATTSLSSSFSGTQAATFHLGSISKNSHNLQQMAKKYSKIPEENHHIYQDTAFHEMTIKHIRHQQNANSIDDSLGVNVQKEQFKFEEIATSTGGPLLFNNTHLEQKQHNCQQTPLESKTIDWTTLKAYNKKNQDIPLTNNIPQSEDRQSTVMSVYPEKTSGSRIEKNSQQTFKYNFTGKNFAKNFNFVTDSVQKQTNNHQISIQVPEISQLRINQLSPLTFPKAQKHHPIKNNFEDNPNNLMWITKQYRPRSQLITKLNLQSFQIKKYKNGAYFGQLDQEGRKHGKGVLFYFNGRTFEGNFDKDTKEGKGFQGFPDGSRYTGQFCKGVKHGRGVFQWINGEVYDGQWQNGKKNGSGMWKGTNRESYIGEWKNGKVQGFGVYIVNNGDRYEGQFVNSLKHGLGTQRFASGDTYVGCYRKNRPNGQGQYYWSNGDYYKGQFCNGLRHGEGFFKEQITKNTYKGQFQNDKYCGLGELRVEQTGQTYVGNFENNIKHGYGEVYIEGNLGWKGYWINGGKVDEHGTTIIEQEIERQETLPENIVAKKRKVNNRVSKSLSPRNQKAEKKDTSTKKTTLKSQCDHKLGHHHIQNFVRKCGCSKKH